MLKAGHLVILCAVALLTLGVLMVNSAGMHVDPVGDDQPAGEGVTFTSILLSRPAFYMALSVVAMTVAALLPVGRLSALAQRRVRLAEHPADGLVLLLLASVALVAVLLSVYLPFLSRHVNGSTRWIQLPIAGGLSVQPSELVKWAMVGLLAWYGARRARWISKFWLGLAPALAALGVVCGVILLEDLGTAVLIGAAGSVVLVGAGAGGARLWQFLLLIPAALAGFAGAVVMSPYRLQRILTFLDPYADPQGAGYHMIQSMATVAGGGGPGRGLGFGLQKFDYLPEDTTDFLFAIVCEELGIVGAALVASLVLGVTLAGLSVARRQTDPLLALLGLGIVATFAFQALINLFVVTGLGPTKGIALPLVSAGGTGWMLTAASLGLLMAMDREPLTQPDLQPESVPA